LLAKSLSEAREGVAIVDVLHPDLPLLYVNDGFAGLTGYAAEEVIGRNYRVLRSTDTEQTGLQPESSGHADRELLVAKHSGRDRVHIIG